MAKRSQLERAIEALDQEIAVLVAAKARLVAQQQQKPRVKRARVDVQPAA
jgi:hypothetical protein